MLIFSQIMLAAASIFAALLLYRQPQPLTVHSKTVASIIATCCMFILLSALLPLVITGNSEEKLVLLRIFSNLQYYLALPLMSSVILLTCLGKNYSKGAWGRWSLVLLASFELCRRALVGEQYSMAIAIAIILSVAIGLLYHRSTLSAIALPIAAIVSFTTSILLFSPELSIIDLSDQARYNFSLAVSLCLVCLCFGQKLKTLTKNST